MKGRGELDFRSLTYPMTTEARWFGREGGMRMAELSLCMIVKNEEARLSNCLTSVQGAVDEIVILDTGSTDGTSEVARRFTDKVIPYAWEDDFAAARNASFAHASKPYILWLDADDVLDPAARDRLIALKERLDGRVDAVFLPYHYAFREDGTVSLAFERERIVRKDAGFVFSGVVHEAMAVTGVILHEDIPVRHTRTHSNGRRNLGIYEAWLARGRRMSARDQYYYARELMACGEHARAEQAFDAFLRMDGWIENVLDAHVQRGACLSALGRGGEARQAILSALTYGEPRPEALCALGEEWLRAGDLRASAFWYRAAMLCDTPIASGAFVNPDARGYIPLMQLCVIYDRMGDYQQANEMNERALRLHPDDAGALSNRAYFAKRLAEVGENGARDGRA